MFKSRKILALQIWDQRYPGKQPSAGFSVTCPSAAVFGSPGCTVFSLPSVTGTFGITNCGFILSQMEDCTVLIMTWTLCLLMLKPPICHTDTVLASRAVSLHAHCNCDYNAALEQVRAQSRLYGMTYILLDLSNTLFPACRSPCISRSLALGKLCNWFWGISLITN